MKVYKTQAEVEKDIKDEVLVVNSDVKFECSISIEASLKIAGDIDARNINAWNIDARNINALDIDAENIDARDIDAGSIDAWNIDAWNIDAGDINAENILYYAFCCVYNSIKCLSIKAKREVHQEPICLDGKLTIKKDKESKNPKTIEIDEATYRLVEDET